MSLIVMEWPNDLASKCLICIGLILWPMGEIKDWSSIDIVSL